jgi:mono/diheme cytochrome c family protein
MDKTNVRNWWPLSIFLALGCATTADDQQRTIEPPSAEGPAATGRAADKDFVLSRESDSAPKPVTDQAPLHIGDKWWAFRADYLKMTEEEVRARDSAISTVQAPQGFWDKQTATETVHIWGSLCNECHGGRRRLKDALGMPPPPEGWGKGDGLFFGNRRDYAAVFATVNYGGPASNGKRSPMPAWTGKLAREQMWALLYFLEFQSGGIEGKFPPSLYPRPLQSQ